MMTAKKSSILLIFFALLIAAIDQVTKAFAVFFKPHLYAVIDNFFYLTLSFNSGSLWGIGSKFPYLLAIVGVVAIACIIIFREKLKIINYPILYGLILGGIAGNTIDRFMYGYVIDFIDIDLHFYRWPIFNIADIAINIGVVYLIFFARDLKKS